jgi:hypothetical protein
MAIRKINEGAYFVPSYSEQTIVSYQPSIANQTIITPIENEEEIVIPTLELTEEDNFTKEDFERALRKVAVKVK